MMINNNNIVSAIKLDKRLNYYFSTKQITNIASYT